MTHAEIEALGGAGWFERTGFPGAEAGAQIAAQRAQAGLFRPAGISRGHQRDEAVRSDSLLWVEAGDVELAVLVASCEALRLELNEGAWLGLTRFDLQLGHFPGAGGHYSRHRDALAGPAGRRVTAIAYLNAQWSEADGGQLRLCVEPPVELTPQLGRLVVFLSEKVEHEVLPVWASRLAATAWYY